MKNIYLFFVTFLSSIQSFTQIFPGQAPMSPSDEFLVGVRYRNLTSLGPLTGSEKYLGIPDKNIVAQRVETNLTYATTQQMSFTYNAALNNISCTSTIGGLPTTSTMSNISTRLTAAGKIRTLSQMNVFQIRIRNLFPTSTTTVSGITLNGMPVPGIFSVSGFNNTQYWFAYFSGYNTTFTLTASIQLSGVHLNFAPDDNVVEFLWGSSIQVLPITIQNAAVTISNNQHSIQYELGQDNNHMIHKSILEGSSNGQHFIPLDSTTQLNRLNHFVQNISNHIQFYRVKILLLNGETKYSVILRAPQNNINRPYKIYQDKNNIQLVSFDGIPKNIVLYNYSGKMITQINKPTSTSHIPILNYAKGIYILHFQINARKYSERIIL